MEEYLNKLSAANQILIGHLLAFVPVLAVLTGSAHSHAVAILALFFVVMILSYIAEAGEDQSSAFRFVLFVIIAILVAAEWLTMFFAIGG